MFTGDIAKFNPADLLMFLGHLAKDGVLTVTSGDQGLQISFSNGSIVDAHAELVDARTLRSLLFQKSIDSDQFGHFDTLLKETGLPLRQLLENIDSLPIGAVTECLENGIREVVFQLFLWESGQFHFAEIPVDADGTPCALACERLTLDTVWRVDEYHEIMRYIDSAERIPIATSTANPLEAPTSSEKFILEHAIGRESIRHIIETSPFSTYESVKALHTVLDRGCIELINNSIAVSADYPHETHDTTFTAYKRALRRISLATDVRRKTTEILNFCTEQFPYSLVVAARNTALTRCAAYSRTNGGRLEKRDVECANTSLEVDPIFSWVHESKHPFIGRVFESQLLTALGQTPSHGDGECAIIPLGAIQDTDFLIYVATTRATEVPGPFHYLELLSWQVSPPRQEPRPPELSLSRSAARSTRPDASDGNVLHDGMVQLVESVKELPSLPNIVAQTLNLLSDTNSGVSELVEVLSRDPAMVARLIKVGNSALYSGGQKITTLSQTVARLGTRTVRSLVLAASTRSLFPRDNTKIGLWGQSLWQHSVECGLASSKVAELAGYRDPEEAFVGGILHDIGKVVILLNLPDEFRAIRSAQGARNQSSVDAEQAVLGFDHAMVGERLLENWRMPENLSACVRYHHAPQDAGEFKTLAYVIAYGNHLSHAHGAQPDQTRAEQALDLAEAKEALNLSEDHVCFLHDIVGEEFKHSDFLD